MEPSDGRSAARDKKHLAIFLLLTFGLSWTIWLLSGVLTRNGGAVRDSAWLIAQVGVFAPSVVGLVMMGLRYTEIRRKNGVILAIFPAVILVGYMVQRHRPASVAEFDTAAATSLVLLAAIALIAVHRRGVLCRLGRDDESAKRVNAVWVTTSLFLLPLFFLISWWAVNAAGGTFRIVSLRGGIGSSLVFLLLAFAQNLLLGGSMGEEFGWRGFVLPLLLKRQNPVAASIVLGWVWALWHLPIDLSGALLAPIAAVFFRLIWTIPLTVIFTWIFLRTGGRMMGVLLLHTSVNMLPDLGFNHYERSMMVMTVLLIVAAVVVAFRPDMRRLIPSPSSCEDP